MSAFTCNNNELDSWLHSFALRSDESDSARVFVSMLDNRVIGYFALTMAAVSRATAPSRLVRGLPAYSVSAVLLARFAIDVGAQGQGYGTHLLALAVERAYRAGEAVAARLLIVDAINEDAAAFSRKFGFVHLPEHPLRLFVRLKDIAGTLKSDR